VNFSLRAGADTPILTPLLVFLYNTNVPRSPPFSRTPVPLGDFIDPSASLRRHSGLSQSFRPCFFSPFRHPPFWHIGVFPMIRPWPIPRPLCWSSPLPHLFSLGHCLSLFFLVFFSPKQHRAPPPFPPHSPFSHQQRSAPPFAKAAAHLHRRADPHSPNRRSKLPKLLRQSPCVK